MREYYVIGPYQLGSKSGKSWVVGIPAEVAKVLQISPSTLFSLRIHKETRSITLQEINEAIERYTERMTSDNMNKQLQKNQR
jgi:antitoxin component of MazEF toxin-antitoxin module